MILKFNLIQTCTQKKQKEKKWKKEEKHKQKEKLVMGQHA